MNNEKKLNLILVGTGLSLLLHGIEALTKCYGMMQAKKLINKVTSPIIPTHRPLFR